MASRRRRSTAGSAGRSRSPSTGSAAAKVRANRNRESRTGKKQVPCPACGTEYIVPAAQLDDPLQCGACERVFVPGKASRRGLQRGNNPAKPYLIGAAIVVAFLLVLVLLDSGPPPESTGPARRTQPERQVELGPRNPRVRDAMAFVDALREGDTFQLSRYVDFPQMREFLGIENIDGDKATVDDRVLQALLSDERAEFLRQAEATSGRISADDAQAETGKVRLYLKVADEHAERYYDKVGEAIVDVTFRDDRGRVTGFVVTSMPRLSAAAQPDRGPPVSTHEVIGAAEDVEREVAGEKRVVREAELKPLDHLEDTPDDVRRTVDEQIALLLDIDGPGYQSNRAIMALKKLGEPAGKPAVPRLLNKLYEIPADSRDNVMRLRRITMALESLTGQRFGFNPVMSGSMDQEQLEADRQSVLRQWYGWWADNHWREDYNYAIDQREDPLAPDPADGDDGNTRRG